jgi:TalC/MipB family fructose-6-phosphate aldolase
MPDEPLLFLKAPSALIASGDEIELPRASQQVEHEGELGVVIGRLAHNIPEAEDPLSYVFGYTCVNDVTARDLQRKDVQFTRGKSFDTFCPVGPWIETDIDPSSVTVQTRLNGEVKQKGNTADMAFSVAFLIRYISEIMTLYPGDLIATGTPAGVSRMKHGDTVEVEVSGIGVLINRVSPGLMSRNMCLLVALIGVFVMKFFLDTANLNEIREGAALGLADGVTTNPSLIAKEGDVDFKQHIAAICEIVQGPVSAEVTSQDKDGMVREGREYSKIAPNVVIKCPLTRDGLKATRQLSDEGIKVNVTLCFSAAQAILAAKAGASFISPFLGRLDDIGENGLILLQNIIEIYQNYVGRLKCWPRVCVIRFT